MRAMGIDPGTAICGFGVVDSDGSRLGRLRTGPFRPRRTEAMRIAL